MRKRCAKHEPTTYTVTFRGIEIVAKCKHCRCMLKEGKYFNKKYKMTMYRLVKVEY